MKWTKEQQKVIDYRNRNILVSAAAGSGKTAVLVERIIKRITDPNSPTDIDRLLVVTFTKAAAAEMRERIGNAIEQALQADPQNENLRRQQTLLHNAQITTIDSFCLFVVRNHFEEIHLEPNFRIADGGEIKLLEMDVLNEVFEAEFDKLRRIQELEEPQRQEALSFQNLIDAYSNKRGSKEVKGMVEKIYRQSASNPWPREWILGLSRPYLVDTIEELGDTEILKGIFSYVKALLQEYPSRLEALKEKALLPDGPLDYAETIDLDLTFFEGLDEVTNYLQLAEFVDQIRMGNIKTIRDYKGDPLKKDAVKSGRNAIKKEIGEIKDRYFSLSMEELLQQLWDMRPIAMELVRLSLLYLDAMEKHKAKKHILDFSDVEHAALRIFVEEGTKKLRPTALEFQNHFDEIMIDEYQDSNQVQEEIMCAISRESRGEYNMFMVGDVKQSIYRFRLARPELFMEKFGTYSIEESHLQRIDLHKNFRSRTEVLEFTNDIFYKIMGKDLGNVNYDKEAALYPGADYPESNQMAAEVLLYEQKPEGEGEEEEIEELSDLSMRQLEARMIADKIIELKDTLKVTQKGTDQLRPLRYSDIVILLRGLKDWGNDFASVLEDCGIPVHVSTSTGYFSAVEVQTILSFLKILDNPYQDIPMAAVLKSAIVGLDNEEMAELSLAEGVHGFAEAVLKTMELAADEETDITGGKLYRFREVYHRLRSRVSDTPIHQLIEFVLEETGYGDYVKALPNGLQRSANLNMLLEKAIAYEKTSYKGLFHFVRYIEQLKKYEVDFGEADIIGENEDVVRIMTIHKSKGLEFPVVFVSGITKGFNKEENKDKMVIHPDLGLGIDERRSEPRIQRRCLIRREVLDRVQRDNLGEELRVLYVAMTRAKEKLILTGAVKNRKNLYEKHKGNIKEGEFLSFTQRVKAQGYIDWIVPAILSYPDKYEIGYKNAQDLILAEAKAEANRTLDKAMLYTKIQEADECLVEQIRKDFTYEYPYGQERGRKIKYSVSEIKHQSMVENYDRMEGEVEAPKFLAEHGEPYIPDFAKPEDIPAVSGTVNPGALYGTAVHRIMECLDYKKLLELDNPKDVDVLSTFLSQELNRMLSTGLITKDMKDIISQRGVVAFLCSDTAQRMAKADAKGNLFREKPFVFAYNGVLIQGIIDVFWMEEDKIVLLDYKTDRVNTPQELLDRYETQLLLYAEALKRVFSTKEKQMEDAESLIYSFKFHQVIAIPNKEIHTGGPL